MKKVYLIGGGPGDPDLITIKAKNVLENASCIFYDNLVNKEILNHAPKHCETIFVGKQYNEHSYTQDEIHALLQAKLGMYNTIVRLKGGDPFIFGRGGEEVDFLNQLNVDIEVVPGITAAVAAASELKIPLTHRYYGQSVIFLSGYSKITEQNTTGLPNYNWEFLATNSLTLVFYMGLKFLQEICMQLINNKMPQNTYATIISHCTLNNQKHIVSTVENIYEESQKTKITFPAILIIGDIVKLYKSNN